MHHLLSTILKGNDQREWHILFQPNDDVAVNCYVNANIAGLWGVKYDQDAISMKSHTGYIIMFNQLDLLTCYC